MNMNRRALILVLFAISCAFGQEVDAPKNATELYGNEALEIIATPDVVYAVLLRDRDGEVSERGKRVQLDNETQRNLSGILISDGTYGWDIWKPCMPVYGVRLVFQKKEISIPLDFCFDCDILRVVRPSNYDVVEDFDSAREGFLSIFKQVFPRDRMIQRIK